MTDFSFDPHARERLVTRPDGSPLPSGTLPRPLTSFIGREHEVEEVQTLLAREDIRLVTLNGPGGVGKTRLAIRIAEFLIANGNTVWFVPIASVQDPALLAVTIASAIGAPAATETSASSVLLEYLQNHPGVLILDNFEHLVDAAVDVAQFLERCPDLKIMATSRTPLRISGEYLFNVPPLPVPASGADLSGIAEARDAVGLFADRAMASRPTFRLTDENAHLVVDICRLLDGLPLAIELAAVRVNVMSLPDLRKHLDLQLVLLTNGPRDAPERHQTLENTIRWSYDLLNPQEQRLFRRLGVFINGFTLEAAEAVGQTDRIVDDLSTLIAGNLVLLDSESEDSPRYTMQEMIRQYAETRLRESDEDSAVRLAHARWFMSKAEGALSLYDGPEVAVTTKAINRELDNCRAAMRWGIQVGEKEIAVRLAGALWRVWCHVAEPDVQPWLDRIQEGRSWLDQTLQDRSGMTAEVLTEALIGLSHFAYFVGDIDTARSVSDELHSLAQHENYPYGIHWALELLGNCARDDGDADSARSYYQQALSIARDIRNPDNHKALILLDLAQLEHSCSNLDLAADYAIRGHEFAQICGNPIALQMITQLLGQIHRDMGNLDIALSYSLQSMEWSISLPDRTGVSGALVTMAMIALDIDQRDVATELMQIASSLPHFVCDLPAYTTAVSRIGDVIGEPAWDRTVQNAEQLSLTEIAEKVARVWARIEALAIAQAPTSEFGHLSTREREILRLIANGDSNRSIAESLSISPRTVENHVLHILTKLDVESRTAAATLAVRHGLG